jgi:hypothetical protein
MRFALRRAFRSVSENEVNLEADSAFFDFEDWRECLVTSITPILKTARCERSFAALRMTDTAI